MGVMESPVRTLLILDLDETLVFASETALSRPADFVAFDYHVYKRPHLEKFLEIVREHFDLAVWSSASDLYVEVVVQNIFPQDIKLHFVWGRSRATLRRSTDEFRYMLDAWDHTHYLKPLAKVKRLGWDLEKVLIVDDTPEKCARNYGNAIYPAPYQGDQDDNELETLAKYLISLKEEKNLRRIEKRFWRGKVAFSSDDVVRES